MIVPVTRQNEAAWAALCIALWPGHTAEEMIEERAQGHLENEYLYYIEDEPAGFVSLSLRHDYVEGTDSSPVGYLEGIYVKPEFRKMGVARALVEFAKQWSRDRHCSEMASDCELENAASHAFHHRIGFKEANIVVCFTMKLDED